MSAQPPSHAGDFAADAFEGAIVGGILVPVFQMILLEIFEAAPQTEFHGSFTLTILIAVIMINLIPLISTLVAITVAYAMGGNVGAVLYVIMALAASAMLGTPEMGAIVFVVATMALAVWLAAQSRGHRATSRRL